MGTQQQHASSTRARSSTPRGPTLERTHLACARSYWAQNPFFYNRQAVAIEEQAAGEERLYSDVTSGDSYRLGQGARRCFASSRALLVFD